MTGELSRAGTITASLFQESWIAAAHWELSSAQVQNLRPPYCSVPLVHKVACCRWNHRGSMYLSKPLS